MMYLMPASYDALSIKLLQFVCSFIHNYLSWPAIKIPQATYGMLINHGKIVESKQIFGDTKLAKRYKFISYYKTLNFYRL
jgi:hypothetical protein